MPIRVLDASVVGRIAAGEVVERPSSVVKELVENSLDAGATSITVEVKGGGIDYLRVTDNGCGIPPGQVRLAFENHATSKLQRAEQLEDIRTLGFRGEALPSIAAVSKVEMTTRARGEPSGVRFSIEGGKGASLREVGCPEGTTFVMRELFYNVPVRRSFLKKPGYEGGLVSDAVARLLLGNPGVSMRFISNGVKQFHSFGDGNLRHAVFAVYGRQTAEGMVELDAFEGGVRIRGLIGVGELAKPTRAHELFFINGRGVRCSLLSKALEEVCRSRVTIGMYPMAVLELTIPPTGVDVNVHPNKLEVRFRDEDGMRAACQRLLSRAFEGERVLEIEKLAAPQRTVARRSEVCEVAVAQPASDEEAPSVQDTSEGEVTVARTETEGSKKQTSVSNVGCGAGGQASLSSAAEATQPSATAAVSQAGASFKPQMPPLPVRRDLADGTSSEGGDARPAPVDARQNASPAAERDGWSGIGSAQGIIHSQSPAGASPAGVGASDAFAPTSASAAIEASMAAPAGQVCALRENPFAATAEPIYAFDVSSPFGAPTAPRASNTQPDSEAAKANNRPGSVIEIKNRPKSANEIKNRPKSEIASGAGRAPYRVIGVAFKTYILVESGDALILIDQHAAHERLQYERYMARATAGTASQQLLAPMILTLSARELAAVEENEALLRDAGYEVEPFGDRELRVTAVPFVLGRAEPKPLFLETLQNLSQLRSATLDARRSEIMQLACKSAVKGGDPLTDSEIEALLDELRSTEAPPSCPHGRPVAKVLTRRDLEKLFKRIQ